MVYKDKHKHEHNQYYNVPIHYRAPWEVNPRTVRSQVNLYEQLDFTHDLSYLLRPEPLRVPVSVIAI